MKHLFVLVLVGMIFLDCKGEKKPPFSDEKIQSILLQIHLADAASSSLLGETKDSMSIVYLDQVKEINKVTDEEIESIFAYLKEDPKYANLMYSDIIAKANEMQDEFKEKEKENKQKNRKGSK